MPKFFASDGRVKTIQIEGARTGNQTNYKPDSQGLYNVESKEHIKAFKESGMVEASLSGVTSAEIGYACGNCGFGSYFKECSRCGTVNG